MTLLFRRGRSGRRELRLGDHLVQPVELGLRLPIRDVVPAVRVELDIDGERPAIRGRQLAGGIGEREDVDHGGGVTRAGRRTHHVGDAGTPSTSWVSAAAETTTSSTGATDGHGTVNVGAHVTF